MEDQEPSQQEDQEPSQPENGRASESGSESKNPHKKSVRNKPQQIKAKVNLFQISGSRAW